MRVFKRLNVVKVTDDEQKAAQLLADGFVEIIAADKSPAAEKSDSKRGGKTRTKKATGDNGGEADGEPTEAEAPAGD